MSTKSADWSKLNFSNLPFRLCVFKGTHRIRRFWESGEHIWSWIFNELNAIEFFFLFHLSFLFSRSESRHPKKCVYRITRAMQTGIHRRMMSRFYTKKPICVNPLNFQSIGIDDAFPAMLLIPYGIAFALIILAFERIFSMKSINSNLCLKF